MTSGQFSARRAIEVSETDEVYQLAVGDIDGNGALDVVVASYGNGSVSWYPNNGIGLFDHRELVSTEVEDASLVNLGDLDSDGDLDVLTAEQGSGTVSWFENDGSGHFASEHIVTDSARTASVSIDDVDADGDLDLFVCSMGDDWLAWFENLGVGLFSPPQGALNLANPTGALLADLNNDGLPDAVHARGVAAYWQANTGNGAFGPSMGLGGNISDGVMSSRDADVDGDIDLFAITYARIGYYENLGGGTFAAMVVVTEDVSGGSQLGFADFDSDGFPDLASASWNDDFLAVYTNDGSSVYPAQAIVTTDLDGASTCATGDMDGDGDVDLIAGSLYNDRVAWFANDGAGTFTLGQVISSQADGAAEIHVVDINNDGFFDLVSAGVDGVDGVDQYMNDGDGSFGDEQLIASLSIGGFNIEVFDLDGDGFKDLLAAADNGNIYWVQNVGGAWGGGTICSSGFSSEVLLSHGDLDGDGDPDLLCSDYFDGLLKWCENLGNGMLGPPQAIGALVSPYGMQARDMDADGDADLVCWNSGTVNVSVNNGGVFTPLQLLFAQAGLSDVVIGDFNGDGFEDVVSSSRSGGTGVIQWSPNNNGVLGAPQSIFSQSNTSPEHMHPTDLDGDGDLDLLVASGLYQRPLAYFENDGSGMFGSEEPAMDLGGAFGAVTSGDLDNDGDQDIVGYRRVAEGLYWAENYLTGPYTVSGTAFLDLDLDGDQGPNEAGFGGCWITGSPCYCQTQTQPDGSYSLALDSGTFNVEALPFSPYWAVTSDSLDYSGLLTLNDPARSGADFGFGPTVDTSIVLLSLVVGPVPCGGTTTLWISATNTGTRSDACLISATIDQELVVGAVSPVPDSIQGNTVWWSVPSLPLFSSQVFEVTVQIPLIQGPAAYLYSAHVFSNDSLGVPTGAFSATLLHPFGCSFDPNDKMVDPSGYGAAGAVDLGTQHLDYTIRFQNTGTAPAFDVMLRDHLSAHLDRTSIQVLATSHTLSLVQVEPDGELVVRFDNIMLPDSGADFTGSQGFIKFRLQVVPGLPSGTEIKNTAEIYFDYNAPVITNTTTTTLVDCDLWLPEISFVTADVLELPQGDAYQWFWNGLALPSDTNRVLLVGTTGAYSASVTNEFGCVAITPDFNVLALSSPEPSSTNMSAVPNPAQESFSILFTQAASAGSRVELVDANGRIIRDLAAGGTKSVLVHARGMAPGVYVGRLVVDGLPVGHVRLVLQP